MTTPMTLREQTLAAVRAMAEAEGRDAPDLSEYEKPRTQRDELVALIRHSEFFVGPGSDDPSPAAQDGAAWFDASGLADEVLAFFGLTEPTSEAPERSLPS